MNDARTVLFFSSCAVDGQGTPDPFMLQELPFLRRHFDRVLLVSYYGVADLTRESPEGQTRIQTRDLGGAAWKARLSAPFSRELWRELGRMAKAGKLTPAGAMKLLLFAIRGQKLHLWAEALFKDLGGGPVTLYAYWMSYEAYAAALSKRRHREARFLCRGHAFDIDPGRNAMNPYLMKRFIAREADELYLISRHAKEQYLRYMEGWAPPEKLKVVGMGSKGEPAPGKEPPLFTEGVFRIVSCASLVEIKQVPVLIDALVAWTGGPLCWLHMGGGPLEEAVRAYAREKLAGKDNVTYEITGRIGNDEVQAIYESRAFDLFVNTSRMEGVPVSIMEAMRFGIPVLAPQVGGVPELVDGSVGLLYPPGEGAAGVRYGLERFVALPRAEVMALRDSAQSRWREECRCEILLRRMFPEEGKRDG